MNFSRNKKIYRPAIFSHTERLISYIEYKHNLSKKLVIAPYKIGILIPTTCKNMDWKNITETYLYKIFFKSFLETVNNKHQIIFYIGIDEDEKLWNKEDANKILHNLFKNRYNISYKFIYMTNINKGHLTKMWNYLFQLAYKDNCDYFFQSGDDIHFGTNNWIDDCIAMLKITNNIGVTGPKCDHPYLLTQTFVSRKHMEIFGCFFPDKILNWYCDDWINEVYQPFLFSPVFKHKCFNISGVKPRYIIPNKEEQSNIKNKLVKAGINRIKSYSSK